jgi:rod shape determining protein RodA
VDLRSYFRHLDYILVAVTLGLVAYGATMVYFATRHDITGDPVYYVRNQAIFAVIGLVVWFALTLVDYEHVRSWQWGMYAVAVLVVVVVYAFPTIRGSHRWIPLPLFNLQASELALVILTLTLPAFLTDRLQLLGTWRVTILSFVYVGVPALIVFAQPDFGTSMVFGVLLVTALLFFGTPWTHFAALGGVLAVVLVGVFKVLPMAGLHLVKSYQIDRLLTFLHPANDPQGSGYNITQSLIAVGSGALHGRGNLATQTTLDFLPEHHTDFIFAVIGERYGFVGAALLLGLFVLLIWRALRIATLSRDMMGAMVAGSIAAMFVFEVFVNIGMTIGIMPITGIPLPFVSYGGSALITNLMMIGLLEGIHLRGRTG